MFSLKKVIKKHVTESIAHSIVASHYLFPSFWQPLNSTSEKRHVFEDIRESTNFWYLYKNESAAQPGHFPSIGTSDNGKGQYLMNTVGEIELSI